MWGRKALSAGCLTVLAVALVVSSAQASSLTLKSGGTAVAPGTGAQGTLRFGPCGSFTSTGTLTNNGAMVDKALFTTFENSPGGCGEGGPSAIGELKGISVSASGLMTLTGAITYRTQIPKTCEYSLTRLMGRFALPGSTSAKVSGTAKRIRSGSEHGCKGALHLTGEEASLNDLETDSRSKPKGETPLEAVSRQP